MKKYKELLKILEEEKDKINLKYIEINHYQGDFLVNNVESIFFTGTEPEHCAFICFDIFIEEYNPGVQNFCFTTKNQYKGDESNRLTLYNFEKATREDIILAVNEMISQIKHETDKVRRNS